MRDVKIEMALLIEECLEVTFVAVVFGPFNRLITDKHFQSRASFLLSSSGIKKKISHGFGFCSRNERFFNYIFVYKLQKKEREEEMTVTVRERKKEYELEELFLGTETRRNRQ